ncbi:bestrophin family ion channel [Flavobacterium sp. DG1-102-2]|uniref:bestrophin family protein n=1 Tax=Flavobacterium sp. DG1-102-2 TaxID=3081663 RepID=UPI00294A1935|nr:bestrophin family ion channel [Flavobacterium sp. DG1-102-2]MDV6169068.1 bestrophin family ion channel [Flavobacterium sp. DG1-102-2]
MLLKKRIPLKYVIGKIKVELALVIAYTIGFEVIHHFYHAISINIPIAVPTIIGTIISLLLAFKSNQAYDRWWEARMVWGAIVNDSRSLMRQIIAFYKDPDFSVEASDFKERFAKRQSAWCYSLAQFLRGKDPIKPIRTLLNEEELRFVKNHKHVPNAILMLHAKELKKARAGKKINTYQQVEIDNTLTRLCDSMGKCERIKNTIFPTTYSMYIRFTLFLFILLLPFGLTDYLGWMQIPVIATIAAACFLIEKMAIHLQDPFENRPTDTPMISISTNIEKNLMQMVNEYRNEFETEQEELKGKSPQPVDDSYFVL